MRLRAFDNHADGINDAVAQSGVPLLDLAANQVEFARQLQDATTAEFTRLGLVLQAVTVQNPSLPDDLQKVLEQKIGMGMGLVGGDMAGSCSTRLRRPSRGSPRAQPAAAAGWWATPWAGCRRGAAAAAAPVGLKPDEVMATIESWLT